MAVTSQPDVPAAEQDIALRRQLSTMWQALRRSPQWRDVVWMTAAAIGIIVLTSLGQIVLNRWNKPFYDSIENKDVGGFFNQLLVFACIAVVLLSLGVGQTWLNQMMRLRLREAFTLDLLNEWLKPGRAFRLANGGAIGVNPDQRMQQDAGHLADMITGLGFGLVQSTLLLVSFVGVLWAISSGFVFRYDGYTLAIPGYMVWAVFIYAGSASAISWLVGRPLIRLNADRYAEEADLRASMVRANENIDAISLAGGEGDARRRIELDLASLVAAIRRMYVVQIWLEWVTDGYGWITIVAPILVAAPIYFTGDMTFGGLMMAVGAFNQVHSSLRWFVNNIGAIADWRATLLRVAAYRLALLDADAMHDAEKRIYIEPNRNERLTLDALEVASPAGRTRLGARKVSIRPGERVLITGDPGAGKTLLFRTLGGLWPWGSGRIGLPASNDIAYVPRTPYFPPGTLRDAIAYPQRDAMVADADIVAALKQVGLERLSGSLDRDGRWDRELSEEEQRLLGCARVGLRQPRWVIIDEALDTLDAAARKRVLAMFDKSLQGSAIINIGRVLSGVTFFTRQIELTKDAAGPALKTAGLSSEKKHRLLAEEVPEPPGQ